MFFWPLVSPNDWLGLPSYSLDAHHKVALVELKGTVNSTKILQPARSPRLLPPIACLCSIAAGSIIHH